VAKPAATTTDPKTRLLAAAMEYVAEHGVGDLSLRAIAAAIGTSHRMLIYHFGSKEGLLIAVIQAVEQEQRDRLAAFDIDAAMTPAEITRQMWKHLSNPKLWPNERLFFEMYGQALQGRAHTAGFLDDIVTAWLEPIAAVRRAQGVSAETAEAQARLDLAVTRGLLLDLLATRDRKGVDAALEQAIALYDAWHDVMPS
jgi:AcrR family transcriptional regulator